MQRLPRQHAGLAYWRSARAVLPLEVHSKRLAAAQRLDPHSSAFRPNGKVLDCLKGQALHVHPVDGLHHVANLKPSAELSGQSRDDVIDGGRVVLQSRKIQQGKKYQKSAK